MMSVTMKSSGAPKEQMKDGGVNYNGVYKLEASKGIKEGKKERLRHLVVKGTSSHNLVD
jgi:hypothetical protein